MSICNKFRPEMWSLLAFGLILPACTVTPPKPAVTLSSGYQQGADAASLYGVAGPWWQIFHDPVLDRLIQRGLASNHDARMAVARVQQARAGVQAVTSRLLPSVALTGSQSESNSGLPAPYKIGAPDIEASRMALDMNWEIDLFGAARAARLAAKRDLLAAQAGIDGARLMVSSEIANQYFTLNGARERLQLLDGILDTLRQTETLTRKRYAAGFASEMDVELATGERLNAEALQPQLQTQVAATQARLAVLLGQDPSQPIAELAAQDALPAWTDPGPVAPGQPVDLLARRPDLRAAEQQLAAESARLQEAHANYLPKFFLNAVFGGEGLTINNVALSTVRYSNVALAFSAPLFSGGRIRAEAQAQSSREQQALINYEKLILTAVGEVETSLAALHDERQRTELLSHALVARDKALAHGNSLYRAGQIDLLQLQILQRSALSAQQSLVESETQRAINSVQLSKALGGDWQPAPATAQAPVTHPTTSISTSIQS